MDGVQQQVHEPAAPEVEVSVDDLFRRSTAEAPSALLLDDCGLDAGLLLRAFSAAPPAHPQLAAVTELDLAVNGLTVMPVLVAFTGLRALYLGGPQPGDNAYDRRNQIAQLPETAVSALAGTLEELTLHDYELRDLPPLDGLTVLRELRLDRNPLCSLPPLPPSLSTLHLEGCPLPGSRDHPRALPATLLALAPANNLQDLQLPTGEHVGRFFGEPLQELLRAAAP